MILERHVTLTDMYSLVNEAEKEEKGEKIINK